MAKAADWCGTFSLSMHSRGTWKTDSLRRISENREFMASRMSNPQHLRSSTDEGLRALQDERLPLAIQRAQAKMQGLDRDNAASALLHAAQRARTSTQRVVWLQRAATAWGRPIEALAACRKG